MIDKAYIAANFCWSWTSIPKTLSVQRSLIMADCIFGYRDIASHKFTMLRLRVNVYKVIITARRCHLVSLKVAYWISGDHFVNIYRALLWQMWSLLFSAWVMNPILAFSALMLLVGRQESIRPVKTEWWGTGMVICLEWSEVQMICIWSSWCHYHPIISCFSKIQNGTLFWCRLTAAVLWKKAVKRM